MISKNLKIVAVICCILITNSLTVDAVNYCKPGYCLDCRIELVSGSKICLGCFNSDLKKIEGLKVQGGECKGEMPYQNCAIIAVDGETETKCHECKPNFKKNEEGTCIPIGVKHCLVYLSNAHCIGCEKGFKPDTEGDNCIPNSVVINNCISYRKDNEKEGDNGPGCYRCNWNYYQSENQTECLERNNNENSDKCYYPREYSNGDCNSPCNHHAGYFASDMSPPIGGDTRILVEKLTASKGRDICTKNDKFNPANPFNGQILTWIQKGLAILCIVLILGE